VSLSVSKLGSIRWAIDELSKQRVDLDAKLKIALKRDETNSLIVEVLAQKKALEQRIAALEDGLRVSSELVGVPCSDLESEMSKIDEKLEIANERLQSIEQEEYLQELGEKLNRAHSSPIEDSSAQTDQSEEKPDFSIAEELVLPSTMLATTESSKSSSVDSSSATAPTISIITASTSPMKATSNRIQNQEVEHETESKLDSVSTLSANAIQAIPTLAETAQQLGIEPDFLAEKGINAILRMIARKGGKLSFPLEVDQID
jgi:hypothetical protein